MDARRGHQTTWRAAPRGRLKLLGAILAGGRSRRFGSDKALALLNGKSLIAHIADGLGAQVDRLVVAGRAYPGLTMMADAPRPDLGPLGGLCGALNEAESNGFDAVLTAPCDSLPVPDLRALLPESGGVLAGWPLFGLWPVALARPLYQRLSETDDRSVFGWIATAGLPEFPAPSGLRNINRPEDLAMRAEMIGDRGPRL